MTGDNGNITHEYLRTRAVSIETALANRVEFPPSRGEGSVKAGDYKRRLGFNTWSTGGLHEIIEDSIWFPCLNQNGSPETWICKPFPPPPGKNGEGPAKFLTERKFFGYPYVLDATWKVAHSPNKPLLLTEGPVKALAALEAGAYAIGVNGVWQTAEKDKENGTTALHPLLVNGFMLSGRPIYLAFDADYATNPSVRQALIRTSVLFLKAGAEVKILSWPIAHGKGLDDFLYNAGGDSSVVLKSLYADARDLGGILRPCDLDHVRAELVLAELADSKLNQICKMVADGLAVRAGNLEKECKEAVANDVPLTEAALVAILEPKLPPITVWNKAWYAYEDGFWQMKPRDVYRPRSLEAIADEKQRTARRAKEVLDHFEGLHQAPADPFVGAYCFDGEDILLSVANGILRIRKDGNSELEDHSSKFFFNAKLPAKYDLNADCPIFYSVLKSALPDKLDRELYLLWIASALIPNNNLECALCCYGPTGTSKSTLAEVLEAAFGRDSTQVLTLTDICSTKGYSLPKLRHAMLNIATELDALVLDDSANFKRLVSGESIPAREIYGYPFTLTVTTKFLFLTNSIPRFKHGTDAELRRLRFLRFDRKPEIIDVELKRKIRREKDGILKLLLSYLPETLSLSELPYGGENSRELRLRFKSTNDPIGSFVSTHCKLDRSAFTIKRELGENFQKYLTALGLPENLGEIFFKQLYDRYPSLTSSRPWISQTREHVVNGISLKPETDANDEK